MERYFDRISDQIDVPHLNRSVRVLLFGLGRFGWPFALLAISHGIRWIRAVEPDFASPENFASGIPEADMGMPKAAQMAKEVAHVSSRVSFEAAPLSLVADNPIPEEIRGWLSSCTIVVLFIDDFAVTSALASMIYPLRPCVFAAALENGVTGEAAWSNPHQTPCLNCSARLPEKRGARGGQTLLVDVLPTVIVALRMVLGLSLIGRKGFELFAPYVDPRRCLAVVINRPGGFVEMAAGRPDMPGGVRLVDVVPENGQGPSCSVCRGYRP